MGVCEVSLFEPRRASSESLRRSTRSQAIPTCAWPGCTRSWLADAASPRRRARWSRMLRSALMLQVRG